MKKVGKLFKNAVIGTVCTSVLATSCSKYSLDNNIYKGFAPNEEIGLSMIDLYDTNMSDLFFQEASCIDQCMQELLNNPDAVRQLLNNPDEFFSKRELAYGIELSEIQKLLLAAFTDEDARLAISNNDVGSFVKVCLEKGYIKPQLYERIAISDLRKYFKTDADFEWFVKSYNLNVDAKQDCVLLVPVVAAAVAAAMFLVGAINIVAVESTAIYHFAAITNEAVKVNHLGNTIDSRKGNNFDPIVRLWTDNELAQFDRNTYIELVENQALITMDEIADMVSDENKEEVFHLIKNQLLAYYLYYEMYE